MNKIKLIETETIGTKNYKFVETTDQKLVIGPDYNYIFNKHNGYMARWGINKEDDPAYSPVGPEILDIEIAKNGCPNNCAWCYKGNTDEAPTNMSFENFKKIIKLFPPMLTQIAIGTTGAKTNPDLIKMCAWCREIGIIPNITVSGMDMDVDMCRELSKYLGAIAISVYPGHKDEAYEVVSLMNSFGMNQVNIHAFTAVETMGFINSIIRDIKSDPKLAKLNAIVFLGVKPKGRAIDSYTPINVEDCKELISRCMEQNISYGFDSCGACRFEKAIATMHIDDKLRRQFKQAVEPCESALFSFYVDVNGMAWYCSFAEDHKEVTPVNVLEAKDFYNDVWYSTPVKAFRMKVMGNNRACPIYKLD
ncbi:hypothetical protein ACFLQL_03020 [Verrucomicrobiota bacterium]